METLGPLAGPVGTTLDDLARRDAVGRLWAGDHTLWQDDPTEVADRLGWLQVAGEVLGDGDRLDRLRQRLRDDGFTTLVVMGMGGSSLFPEVVARTFRTGSGGLDLRVLDTTDPTAVQRIEHECDLDATFFLASSKSGGTLETRSHMDYFWDKVGRGAQFAVVTDAGSQFEAVAAERGYRETFLNRSDIGGRYSALSYFGLVPAALAGTEWRQLVRAAGDLADQCGPGGDTAANPGARLGAIMGTAVQAGRDKLTLVLPPEVETFGLWLEQLLAESTGKQGTGVIPVAGERLGSPDLYGDDRLFVGLGEHHGLAALAEAGHPVVELPFDGPRDLGAQVLLWELATAICGAVLGINPFDQPNVAEAKAATNQVLADGLPDVEVTPLDDLLAQARPGDYLSIQAYVDPEDGVVDAIEDARTALRDRLRLASTVGLGPRFLHSTGQLHKGGPNTGLFVQVVGEDLVDVPIPGQPFTFGTLLQAQAAGDLLTLRAHGRRAARVAIDDLLAQTR